MINILQEYQSKDWAGLTTKNHLGYAHMLEPQKSLPYVTMIHQMRFGYNDLDSYLNKFPKIILETDDNWQWDLMGGGMKNVPLVKASLTSNGSAISATDKPGISNGEFYLTFPEYYFSDVDVIFGHKQEYQVRIKDEPLSIGNNWEYRVELVTGDPSLFMPYDELQSGKRFSKQYSLVESTLSKKGGKVNYTSPFRMRNAFTRLRMEDTRPGNMVSRPMGVTMVDPKTGKKTNLWQDFADWQFDMQFMAQKNKALYYSRINKTASGNINNKGKSGFELEQGAGLRQQIESSNTVFYPTNNFNIQWLINVLLDLSENKLAEDQRKFLLRTGERGMVQFSQAIQDYSNLFVRILDDNRIAKVGGNALEFSGQFMRFKGPQGIEIDVMHDPIKDDRVDNKELHPNGGVAESYVYDILDVGTSNGESNIRKVVCKGSEDIKGYIAGLRDPYSPFGGAPKVMSTAIDGYSVHRMWIGGVQVTDPTRCMVLKPQILQ